MFDTLWSKFVLQLNKGNPFFACLALFTQVVPDDGIEISSTTGREIRINPDFILNLTDEKAFSYLLHQVLHLALQHNSRGKNRDEAVWNIAADIVVNDIITSSTQWPNAPSTAWDKRFSDCSVEQVYANLHEEFGQPEPSGGGADNASADSTHQDDEYTQSKKGDTAAVGAPGADAQSQDTDKTKAPSEPGQSGQTNRSLSELYRSHSDLAQGNDNRSSAEQADDARYWQDATAQARVAIDSRQAGQMPGSLEREFERVAQSGVNWQRELWRFVSHRQTDFTEFDSRHIHRGLYVEQLRVDGLNLCVAIDTSGSINREELGVFMTELDAIRRLYTDVTVSLYYCDVALDGPHVLQRNEYNNNPPTGNGGTSFQPVFDAVKKLSLAERPDCLIYFTDGEAEFPKEAGPIPTLWMLTSGGSCRESDIPFGTSLRMAPVAA